MGKAGAGWEAGRQRRGGEGELPGDGLPDFSSCGGDPRHAIAVLHALLKHGLARRLATVATKIDQNGAFQLTVALKFVMAVNVDFGQFQSLETAVYQDRALNFKVAETWCAS